VDSTTNPSYQWTFRYNAGSASAYKWEFIGGTDAYVEVLTAEGTVTLSTWLDLATVGPRVIVPRGGDYDAQAGADFAHGSAAGAYANMGIARNATTPTGAVGRAITSPTPAYPVMMLTSARLVGVTASDDLRLRYYAGSAAGTNNWGYRWIRVRPVRVA
jgi:hypothetical protein